MTPATADIIWPWGLDLDLNSGKVYWVDGSVLKLQRANLDGTEVEELIAYGAAACFSPRYKLVTG